MNLPMPPHPTNPETLPELIIMDSVGVCSVRSDTRLLAASAHDGAAAPGRALDLGAGAGYVGLYLAQRGWQVDAVDISPRALQLTRANAQRNHLALAVYASNLFDQTPGDFDVIACNPPMRPGETELSRLITSTLRRSPRLSQWLMNLAGARLEGNRSAFLAHIVAQARRQLRPDGRLLLAINAGEVAELARLPGVHLQRALPIPGMGAQQVAEFRFEALP